MLRRLFFAFVFKQNTAEKNVTEAQLEDYVLSFRVDSMRQSTMNMIEAGDTFYTENSKDFGTLQDSLTMTPAVVYPATERMLKHTRPKTAIIPSGTFPEPLRSKA